MAKFASESAVDPAGPASESRAAPIRGAPAVDPAGPASESRAAPARGAPIAAPKTVPVSTEPETPLARVAATIRHAVTTVLTADGKPTPPAAPATEKE